MIFPGQMRQLEGRRLNNNSRPKGGVMQCICGGRCRIKERNPERGIITIVCTTQGCGTEYSYPIDHPAFKDGAPEAQKDTILMPGFTPANQPIKDPPRLYRCKGCGAPIDKEQAHRSFATSGKALCRGCQEDA